MCLSTVYKSGDPNTAFAEYVTGAKVDGDKITFTDITGNKATCQGAIASIDLVGNVIVVDELAG
ncbi:MAG: CooT family nickel-binding protein [Clostridiales Family XIII bacterium]|jgi:predicted RNA-binding protein|nr:CooT family nickel-binding protein [Clostridiales Family XIII bacterium]